MLENDQFWGSFWVCFPHPCESSWEYQKGSQFQRHLMQKKSTAMSCWRQREVLQHQIQRRSSYFHISHEFPGPLFHYCTLRWLKHFQNHPWTHLQGINPWVGSQPLRPAGRFVLSEVVVSDGTAFFRLEMEADCGPLRSRCWGCNTRLQAKAINSGNDEPIHRENTQCVKTVQ